MPKDDKRGRNWRRIDHRKKKWEKSAGKDVSEIFSFERELLIAAIRKDGLNSILNTLSLSETKWENFFQKTYSDVIVDFVNLQILNNSISKEQFDFFLQVSTNTFIEQNAGQKITYISNTTKQKVSRIVEEANRQAYTASQVQDALLDGEKFGQYAEQLTIEGIGQVYESFEVSRALMIARTEVGSASSYGQLEAGRLSGANAKIWTTARDPEVRQSHAPLDGVVIPIDGIFPNGLRFPLDPAGPPSEIINCRCALSFQ